MINQLYKQFNSPDSEFSPIPFWFWNDDMDEYELVRQVHDFKSKGVSGFVIHPRMGIPGKLEYLSEDFLDLVETVVREARELGMTVILYDEAMYPSGSAGGRVVRGNPEFASRGLGMTEVFIPSGKELTVPLEDGEFLVAALAVKKTSSAGFDRESVRELTLSNGILPSSVLMAEESLLLFTECYSRGTIRGIHPGEDDGEPHAPPSADLLNTRAMKKFITLTHDIYYERLKEHFGTTIKAFFTDEPDILGRNHRDGLLPWTKGFMDELIPGGFKAEDLPALWLDGGDGTENIRRKYWSAVNGRMEKTYYAPLSRWCEEHRIALTGHPQKSDQIGLLRHFQIPGQDLVWRWVAPEGGLALEGEHSTMAKCSSDSARHRGRQRNANECFGCCGPGGDQWAFSLDDMKWYLDWMFVRGVNLLYPHAFYYSLRGDRVNERPPDVGPGNIWWEHYCLLSAYMKRMSWLMTDSVNQTGVALFCGEEGLPWKTAKELFQKQIEFNYLEQSLLLSDNCRVEDGEIGIEEQKYSFVLVEDSGLLTDPVKEKLTPIIEEERLLEINSPAGDDGLSYTSRISGINGTSFTPSCPDLRLSHVVKKGVHFYLLVNEGERPINGSLWVEQTGRTEIWDAWTGEAKPLPGRRGAEQGLLLPVTLERRESMIICLDTDREPVLVDDPIPDPVRETYSWKESWRISGIPGREPFVTDRLTSWTGWDEMSRFSGTLIYESSFLLGDTDSLFAIMLDLGQVGELAEVYINDVRGGVLFWKPYCLDISSLLCSGKNHVRVVVTNSRANALSQSCRPSGLIGPVRLIEEIK